MLTEEVLAHPPKALSQEQRQFYFDTGYLSLDSIVPMAWVERLRAATEEMVERSRGHTVSDRVFDLEPNHRAEKPRLRRLTSPVEHHPAYWEFASESIIVDIAADLVGPDVKFHHSKLNFKWAKGGEQVKWHQDIPAWPHTNYSPLTIGTYLSDIGPDQAPLAVIPNSHEGELYSEFNAQGQWVGYILPEDLERVPLQTADYLVGSSGTVTVHNCRTIHGSKPNRSSVGRPLLLNVYSAADAFTYSVNPIPSRYADTIVRGKPARWAHHDPRPGMIPPDWSKGYTSLFAMQQEEA